MDLALQLAIFGIASSVGTELITKINKALNGTVLAGRGANILAGAVAVVFGVVTFILNPTVQIDAHSIALVLSAIYGISQAFYKLLMKNLGWTTEVAPTA